MSIFRLARKNDPLNPEHRKAAWRLAYRTSLDELPDSEIQWEADLWRANGAESIAAIGDDLLAERRGTDFAITGGAEADDLHRLLSRVNTRAAVRLVEEEGLCLVAAIRTVFWAGLREVRR